MQTQGLVVSPGQQTWMGGDWPPWTRSLEGGGLKDLFSNKTHPYKQKCRPRYWRYGHCRGTMQCWRSCQYSCSIHVAATVVCTHILYSLTLTLQLSCWPSRGHHTHITHHTLEILLKYFWNFLSSSLKHSKNPLATSLKNPWMILQTPMNHLWNMFQTSLKHTWNTLEISLKQFETSLNHLWIT